MFVIERAGLEGSYLNFLLDVPFPNDIRFTARLVASISRRRNSTSQISLGIGS